MLLHTCVSGYRVLWKAGSAKARVPLSEYPCSAPIHFAGVLECASEVDDIAGAEDPCNHTWLPAALTTYMHDVASGLRHAPGDVCWFVQTPYIVARDPEAPGTTAEGSRSFTNLSNSACSASPECCLSGSIALDASRIECLLLSAEYDFVTQAIAAEPIDGADGCGQSSAPHLPTLEYLQGLVEGSRGSVDTPHATHSSPRTPPLDLGVPLEFGAL